jgi:hypothetical protein
LDERLGRALGDRGAVEDPLASDKLDPWVEQLGLKPAVRRLEQRPTRVDQPRYYSLVLLA